VLNTDAVALYPDDVKPDPNVCDLADPPGIWLWPASPHVITDQNSAYPAGPLTATIPFFLNGVWKEWQSAGEARNTPSCRVLNSSSSGQWTTPSFTVSCFGAIKESIPMNFQNPVNHFQRGCVLSRNQEANRDILFAILET
jgi:hypothetical protein